MMQAFTSFLQERSPSVIAVIILSGTYLLYTVLRVATTAYRRSAFSRANGCKPIPSYPHKDPVFGLDVFFEGAKLLKAGQYCSRVQERYGLVNNGVNTFSQILLGKRIVVTGEPENIKAILATKFKDFNYPRLRKDALQPLFGHGIFTTDGKQWEDSRSLLRPSFTRSLIGDLAVFESHVSKMIDRIPRDGSTVDIQKLFFMLTLDSGNFQDRLFIRNRY
jgi:cytochrome P450